MSYETIGQIAVMAICLAIVGWVRSYQLGRQARMFSEQADTLQAELDATRAMYYAVLEDYQRASTNANKPKPIVASPELIEAIEKGYIDLAGVLELVRMGYGRTLLDHIQQPLNEVEVRRFESERERIKRTGKFFDPS